MNYRNFTLLISFFFIGFLSAQAQGYLHTNGKAIVDGNEDTLILRGMGLGGWMLQEGYMLQTASFATAQYQIRDKIEQLIGTTDMEIFYDKWRENHVRKVDIDSLKSWGFNSVRLPMHYNLFTLPIEDEPIPGEHTWLTTGFEMTDSLISWCKQNQMYVILDLHAAPGGQGYDQAISDYDPTKPSLWESKANRDKAVALWKRLATRYANEPTIGGYDLLNEVNWNLNGNIPLRDLYHEMTDSIRTVDTNHIIFIEGNWFANDFTALTPPWDNNMVYSPHKYWSVNDQGSIQWVLDIRNNHNVPLYFGESGENSNVWFRDAIKLMEDNGIGWAWWPMKKVESIAGPLSVIKTSGYQTLLNYWENGGTPPPTGLANATLLQLADNLKMENCVYQKDVIDAMFRQVQSDEAIPFNIQTIPGIVYASDFDMGVLGSAYWDNEVANYSVTTGNFTSWNNGWIYRNDGVDLEAIQDNVNTNGYNVGWIGTGEWMQYSVDVTADAVYDINVRVAANGSNGKIHFASGNGDITQPMSIPSSGGWQSWQTITVPDVVLTTTDNKLRFYVDGDGFNLSSFEFVQKGVSTAVPTEFVSALTLSKQSVQLNLNKAIAGPLPASPADFQITADGNTAPITDVAIDPTNSRVITFTVNYNFKFTEDIRISYTGNQIDAQDGTPLNTFNLEVVQNNINSRHFVPGKIEAEDFFDQVGIQLENTTDTGGGQNIGYLDVDDYLDYLITVDQNGTYNVDYRTASESAGGGVRMEIIDENGNATTLHTVSFPSTGGWQNWTNTNKSLSLDAGEHLLRMVITEPLFNMNWFDITFSTAIEDVNQIPNLNLFPNPGTGLFSLQGTLIERQDVEIQVSNMLGQTIKTQEINKAGELNEVIDLSAFPKGNYFVSIRMENGAVYTKKLVKI